MELRSCGNSHFIQALKNGSVVKTINIYHGKPSLRFKAVEDLYETKDEFFPLAAVEAELTTPSSGRQKRRRFAQGNVEALDPSPSDCETDDHDFDKMSLTQLMDLFGSEQKQPKVVFHENSEIKQDLHDGMLETIGSFQSRTLMNARTTKPRRSAEHQENPSVRTDGSDPAYSIRRDLILNATSPDAVLSKSNEERAEDGSVLATPSSDFSSEPADEDKTCAGEGTSVAEKPKPSPSDGGEGVPEAVHPDVEDQLLHERLISKRKAISPTSRSKLLEAMESFRLHDEEYYKCARKLCYENQTDNKACGEERKNGTNDFPRVDDALDNEDYGMQGGSSRNNVVLFSQKQMQGTKYVAAKLTKELNSLVHILKETLALGAYSSPRFKFRADEVNAAVLSATREAASIRRLLHCMSRDCTRFCKIMSHRVMERASPPAPSIKIKRKRKIIFADEAGGNLCEIKIFEKDVEPTFDFDIRQTGTIDSIRF